MPQFFFRNAVFLHIGSKPADHDEVRVQGLADHPRRPESDLSASDPEPAHLAVDRPAIDRADKQNRGFHMLIEKGVVEAALHSSRRPVSGSPIGPEGKDGDRLRPGFAGGLLDRPALRSRLAVGAVDLQGVLGVPIGRPEGSYRHILPGPSGEDPRPGLIDFGALERALCHIRPQQQMARLKPPHQGEEQSLSHPGSIDDPHLHSHPRRREQIDGLDNGRQDVGDHERNERS